MIYHWQTALPVPTDVNKAIFDLPNALVFAPTNSKASSHGMRDGTPKEC